MYIDSATTADYWTDSWAAAECLSLRQQLPPQQLQTRSKNFTNTIKLHYTTFVLADKIEVPMFIDEACECYHAWYNNTGQGRMATIQLDGRNVSKAIKY